MQYNALSSTFLIYLKNNFKYFLSVIIFSSSVSSGFFSNRWVYICSPLTTRVNCDFSSTVHWSVICSCYWFSQHSFIYCRVCPLKSFISLLFLNSNLFWAIFSPPCAFWTPHRYCWDGLLGDLLVASGVSLCFPNWTKVILSLYFVRPRYYSHVWSGESMKEALHPDVPLWFVVGIIAHMHVQPFYASFLW